MKMPSRFPDGVDARPRVMQLLTNIKTNMPALEELLARCKAAGDDGVYRFYHQSYKVYTRLQPLTSAIVLIIETISPTPGQALNDLFSQIVDGVAGRGFANSDNANWLACTRTVVEAYFHSRYFLEQMIVFGKELEVPPQLLPEEWAAVLTLYNLR